METETIMPSLPWMNLHPRSLASYGFVPMASALFGTKKRKSVDALQFLTGDGTQTTFQNSTGSANRMQEALLLRSGTEVNEELIAIRVSVLRALTLASEDRARTGSLTLPSQRLQSWCTAVAEKPLPSSNRIKRKCMHHP